MNGNPSFWVFKCCFFYVGSKLRQQKHQGVCVNALNARGRKQKFRTTGFKISKFLGALKLRFCNETQAGCQADYSNIQGNFPVLLQCVCLNAIKLTFSWFFLRWMSSSFRVSISLSRFMRLRLVSSMTFRRPTMSASTDWRMASSDSYLNRVGQSGWG